MMGRMSFLVSIDKEKMHSGETRIPWLNSWLQLVDISNIIIVLYFILRLCGLVRSMFERAFKKNTTQFKNILVFGTKNEINDLLLEELSQCYQAELINIDKTQTPQEEKKRTLPIKVLYSQNQISSQEEMMRLSKQILVDHGGVDLLVISYSPQQMITEQKGTNQFLANLNTQLLAQFWTVMAFLPSMMDRNKGRIVSIALDKTGDVSNLGIIRTIYEDVLQSDSKVKFTLIEKNRILDKYFPSMSPQRIAKFIVDSLSSDADMVFLPTYTYYFFTLPLTIIQEHLGRFKRIGR